MDNLSSVIVGGQGRGFRGKFAAGYVASPYNVAILHWRNVLENILEQDKLLIR